MPYRIAERREYGGKSRFGRGGRRRFEREQAVKQELAIQAKIDKEGTALGVDAFSGIAPVPGAPLSSSSVLGSLR